jgi:hypothetical protein
MSRTYRRRGVAINYAFFDKKISTQKPYIRSVIYPENWQYDPVIKGYLFTIPKNILKSYDTIYHTIVNHSSRSEIHMPVIFTNASVQLQSNILPSGPVELIALPVPPFAVSTVTLDSNDFSMVSGGYRATVDLSGYSSPVLAKMRIDADTPAYYYTIMTDTTLILDGNVLPFGSLFVDILH